MIMVYEDMTYVLTRPTNDIFAHLENIFSTGMLDRLRQRFHKLLNTDVHQELEAQLSHNLPLQELVASEEEIMACAKKYTSTLLRFSKYKNVISTNFPAMLSFLQIETIFLELQTQGLATKPRDNALILKLRVEGMSLKARIEEMLQKMRIAGLSSTLLVDALSLKQLVEDLSLKLQSQFLGTDVYSINSDSPGQHQ